MDAFGFAMDACATKIFAEGGSLKKQETDGHKELAAASREASEHFTTTNMMHLPLATPTAFTGRSIQLPTSCWTF